MKYIKPITDCMGFSFIFAYRLFNGIGAASRGYFTRSRANRAWPGRLNVTYAQDFVFAHARGGLHGNHIALGLADKRPGNGAGYRNTICADVGFDVAYDLIGYAFARFEVFDFDGGAKHGPAFDVQGGGVDDLGIGKRAFKFFDTAFDKCLALARGVVFGIFRQVALCTGFGNGIDDFGRSIVFRRCSSFCKRSAPLVVNGIADIIFLNKK